MVHVNQTLSLRPGMGFPFSPAEADWARADQLSYVMGMEPQKLALVCVPWTILTLTANQDRAGLAALAKAAGSDCLAMMQAHGHIVIAKRLYGGA